MTEKFISDIRVIILAAGRGSRLSPLTDNCPKSLLPVGGKPLLIRTLQQMKSVGFSDIAIVVGYESISISNICRAAVPDIKIIPNEYFSSDTNCLSLQLALSNCYKNVLVFEADVVVSDRSMEIICDSVLKCDSSVWFTNGPFRPYQIGGIVRSDGNGNILDLKYVPVYDERWASYSKFLGVLYICQSDLLNYKKLLFETVSKDTKSYYTDPWMQHIF